MAVALAWMAGAAASPLPAAMRDLGTLPATLMRRFDVPIVRDVIGGENGGRELALVADVDDDSSEYPSLAWWTRRPGRHGWSYFRLDAGLWVHWPGRLMAVERASPETIYFVDDDWILRRSTDGGETWTRRGRLPGGEPFQLLAAERPGVLFLTTFDPDGLFRSTDGGLTWSDLGKVADSIATLAFTPADPDLVIGYASGAIVRSRDGGDSFVDISPGRWSGANELAVARSDATVVYALPYEETPFLRRSRNGGTRWQALAPPAADLVGVSLAVDPERPAHLVVLAAPHGEEESSIPRAFESFDGGDHWRAGAAVPASRLRFVADEQGVRLEAFGRRGLYESRDGGATWRLGDDGITADHDLLIAVASGGGEVFVAEREGDLWRSTDGGRGWERRGRLPGAVSQLLVSPLDPGRLAAIASADDVAGYRLWWSENAGADWNEVPRPRDADEDAVFVHSLSFDPLRPDVLYAASTWDAWRTADRGRTWERLTGALPGVEDCSDATGSCWVDRDAYQVIADPLVPTRLYVLYLGEWMRSDDSGGTWASIGQGGTLVPDPRVRDRLYAGQAGVSGTQVFVSDRAGDPPWRRLRSSTGDAPFRDTWMTLDGEGNLLVQPQGDVNVFLRRREHGGWDRFSLRLPGGEISRVVAGGALPGGGSVLFVVLRGVGLWRVELPGSAR